jgi:hypothetical protein
MRRRKLMTLQQLELSNKVNIFMEKIGWPIITLAVGTALASIIVAIWFGKVQVVDFNWIMLILGCLMFGITVFFAWYSIRRQHILQKKYEEDLAAIKAEFLAHQIAIRDNFNSVTRQWQKTQEALSKAIPNTITTIIQPRKPH